MNQIPKRMNPMGWGCVPSLMRPPPAARSRKKDMVQETETAEFGNAHVRGTHGVYPQLR